MIIGSIFFEVDCLVVMCFILDYSVNLIFCDLFYGMI